jgi:hypothetical protein
MKFSVRDLFLVTMIVALTVGWAVDRSRLAKDAAESQRWEFRTNVLAAEIRGSGGAVSWTDTTISGSGPGHSWMATGP